MFIKGKRLIGVILTILLVFSVSGFTAYYKYTQESGANFYVGTADKADALEDTNEMRQIIDDLGALLVHSRRDGVYPKTGPFGGTIQIPEAGLKFGNNPANDDIAAYIAGEMMWQTKAELGIDLTLYYLKTEMDSFSELQAIISDKTLVNVEDGITATAIQDDLILKADFADEDWGDMTVATNVVTIDSGAITYAKIQNVSATDKILGRSSAGAGVVEEVVCTSAGRALIDDVDAPAQRTTLGIDLSLYYLKTEIDTLSEVEAIYTKNIIDSDELAALEFVDLTDTPANYTGSSLKFARVNVGETALEFAAEADPNVDTDAEIKAILVDEVTKTGDFTAGRMAKINNASGIIEMGTNTDADVADAVTKKHTSGSETCVGDVSGTVGANTVDKIKGHTVDETAIGDDKILVYKTTGTKFVYEAKPAAGSTTFLGLTDTPGDYTGKAGEILRVAVDPPGVEFSEVGIETTLTVDSDTKIPTSKAVNDFCETTQGYPNTDAEIKAILVDEVTKTGDFTAGKIAMINNATGIIEQGTNTDTDVADAVTKKHSQNTDTQFDFYNALADNLTWSGDKDTQLVGESVVFGNLLYFDWTDKEWKKADADAAGTMPGLRIALESKTDGQTCLMLVKGYIRDDSAFEFAGAMIYASVTTGAMSSTAPTETGDQVQRVGVAKSADILFFDPSIDVGEI